MHIFSTIALTLLPCLISQKVSLLGIINNINSYDACALFHFFRCYEQQFNETCIMQNNYLEN